MFFSVSLDWFSDFHITCLLKQLITSFKNNWFGKYHWMSRTYFVQYMVWILPRYSLHGLHIRIPCISVSVSLTTYILGMDAQISKFMGPTWGPPGSSRPQIGPMLVPWTLLSGWFDGHKTKNELSIVVLWLTSSVVVGSNGAVVSDCEQCELDIAVVIVVIWVTLNVNMSSIRLVSNVFD